MANSYKRKQRRKKFGHGKKGKARAAADAALQAAISNYENIGNDPLGGEVYGGSMKKQELAAYIESLKTKPKTSGASMKFKSNKNIKMDVPAKQLMRNQKDEGGASMPLTKSITKDVLKKLAKKKKGGASMNAYQDKEASMDDYSHEKKLGADGRYDLEHGHKNWAKNDFDHAHALKKDAHHDAGHRHAIMKHMKGF